MDEDKNGLIIERQEFFESFALEVHGIGGKRHDVHMCDDKSCAHPDHGLSTAGKSFEGNERAGDVYDGQGSPDPEHFVASYDPGVAAGGDSAIEALERRADRDPRGFDDWQRLQKEAPTSSVGGGSRNSGKKQRPQNAVVCTECHLEYCTCAGGEGVQSRRGRRRMYDTEGVYGRSSLVAFRVSEPAKEALQTREMAVLLDELGFAILNGLTIEAARARLGIQDDAA